MLEKIVSPAKHQELLTKMAELGILETDLLEKFILGTGKGGQKMNKTASGVYLKHLPSGLEIKCQTSRQRALNRFFARRRLCAELAAQLLGKASPQNQAILKIRRQKARRQRRSTL